MAPAKMIFGRKLRLPCDLFFGTPPGKQQPSVAHAPELVKSLAEIHTYAHEHLEVASDRIKVRYDLQVNSA